MVVEQILEGLKMALLKGESLQQAMQSFSDAGYGKQDIEAAAQYLQSLNAGVVQPPATQEAAPAPTQPTQTPTPPTPLTSQEQSIPLTSQTPQTPLTQPQSTPLTQIPQTPLTPQTQAIPLVPQALPVNQIPPMQPNTMPVPQTIQRVSNYGYAPPRSPRIKVVIFLIVLLIVFGVALLGVLLFREMITDFFSSLGK